MSAVRALLCGALALVVMWMAGIPTPPATPVAPVVAAQGAPTPTPREAWALALLTRLGNGQPSAATVAMVVEWTIAEDGSGDALARGNPLNTTMPGYRETHVINADGVRGYGDMEAGLQATVATLTNGLYDDVVAALLANDPDGARRALWASPWAASHYGYGTSWPTYAH